MRFSRRFLFTGIASFISFFGFARQVVSQKNVDTFETHLKSSIITYYKKYPQEKVFIHTNQEAYSSGQTIWYKVYTMVYGKPSGMSRVVYVQLTDTSGKIITHHKLHLIGGRAYGNIGLDEKLKSGWYELSAFTRWMMNFDKASRFHQKIYIHNAAGRVGNTISNQVAKKAYHIDFYPEGGDLIDGNSTKIAFKAGSDDGLPAKAEGVINDGKGKVIVTFTTMHDGLGYFNIEPSAGMAYSAKVNFPDGSMQQVKLPEVKKSGIWLQALQGINSIQVKLAFAGTKAKTERCILAAFQNSGKVITYPLELTNGINEFSIPDNDFSTGILRLTVFDPVGMPTAERLVFINKHDLKSPVLKTDTLSFSAHSLNSFSLILKNKDSMPVQGNFSVAVTDGDAFGRDAGQNIVSALLLSPELKGEIYHPGYYFENESDSLAAQLDLVMLTNGWRHFVWQNILQNKTETLHYPVERSLNVAGKVEGYKGLVINKDQFKIKALLINADSTRFLGYVTPDTTGSFIFRDFDHSGMSDIYLQTADKKAHIKKLNVKMLPTLDDSLKQSKTGVFANQAPLELSSYFISQARAEARYTMLTNSVMLKTVTIKGQGITPTEKLIREHSSSKFLFDRAYTLDLVNNPTVNIGLISYIKGKFPGLMITGDDNNPVFLYHGGNTLRQPAQQPYTDVMTPSAAMKQEMGLNDNPTLPYFYLNNAPVEWTDIKDISLDEIALIRFMPPPVGFAPYNGGDSGAIVVYTRRQSDEARTMNSEMDFDHFIFNGYSITREFNTPDYHKIKQAGLVDDRTTIYWNHDLDTDNNGVLKFRFYNSDVSKKFRVTIQGMDTEGRLVYLQQMLN